jgi:hypothetical protein
MHRQFLERISRFAKLSPLLKDADSGRPDQLGLPVTTLAALPATRPDEAAKKSRHSRTPSTHSGSHAKAPIPSRHQPGAVQGLAHTTGRRGPLKGSACPLQGSFSRLICPLCHRSKMVFGMLEIIFRCDPIPGQSLGTGQYQIAFIVSLGVFRVLRLGRGGSRRSVPTD